MKNLVDMELKSSLKFQLIFFICAIMHTTFFILFWYTGSYFLMLCNIISISFYLLAGVVSRKGAIEKHSLAWIAATYGEITVHASLCTVWLGFESCFYLYSIVSLTVSAYVLYLSCDKDSFFKYFLIFGSITAVAMAFCLIFLSLSDPVITVAYHKIVNKNHITLMRAINITYDIFATFLFSGVFIVEIQLLIKKLNIANEKLNYTAMHDALTGLYNRHSLYELYSRIDGDEFCVIMGDIDDFKKINDTYGHSCGDEVLRNISSVISNSIHECDIACRWGGEEFLIVIRGAKDACLNRLKAMRSEINALVIVSNDKKIKVTMTFGFVDCHEMKEQIETAAISVISVDALVQIADKRLYQGKASGKNIIID